jgi:leucyl-tRNA synthetase
VNEYNHKKIEQKWQKVWEKKKLFKAIDGSKKPKFYGLIEFPYPSGDGLHVGHIRSNTAMDVICRKRRMEGFNVLYPIGWDAFGLPTENYAIKTGIHPIKVTKKNTDTFRRQLKAVGFSFDWEREINTTDPKYYKWTQWIFLQLLKRGLAYKKKMPINWCPSCKIGLANEEVVDGACERCGTTVEKKDKEQWMLAITKYADRLDKDLDDVNFLEKIKIQQRNWIGKSDGAEIEFKLKNSSDLIKVFTTRPDTIFGVTYVVLSPEHKLISKIKNQIENFGEVEKYILDAKNKTDIERTGENKEKTGVELKGVKAINPVNNEEVSVWVADYVLVEYGTGAVMAVPAHDDRDFEFAKKYSLKFKEVVSGGDITNEAYIDSGVLINSGKFNGLNSEDAKWKITEVVGGKKITKFKLRDWVFSRQHYWGEPIPVVFCDSCKNKKYNIVLIHGFNSDSKQNWQPWLKGELERMGHKVFGLDLPNPSRPLIDEQVDYILKNTKIDKNTILVGHSLGGAVILRLLERTKSKIYKVVIVDSPIRPKFNDKERLPLLNAHDWKFDFKKIKKNSENFVVLADSDYVTVPKEQLDELAKELDARYITSKPNAPHFKGKEEPEILKVFEDEGMIPISESKLPVKLPDVEKYQPTDDGESPLSAIKKWVEVKCPVCGGVARRETDTMPNWAGSSWYYLRYIDPKNSKRFVDSKKINYWNMVDWYNGGMEHTTLHLLYSRFWHKFLFDIGVVPTKEPYNKRTSHGLILAEGGVKMSKSKGNVINPDDIVNRLGADSLRVYEMFMGPFDQAISWSVDGIVGARRFIEKVWRVGGKVERKFVSRDDKKINEDIGKVETLIHKTVKKVGDDIEEMRFNTAISALMICINEMDSIEFVPKELFGMFLKILSPFAPHLSEELWSNLGFKGLISNENWPVYDSQKIVDNEVTIVVQINGKIRGQFRAPSDIVDDEAKKQAKNLPEVQNWIKDKKIVKEIYVKGKLVSIVIV